MADFVACYRLSADPPNVTGVGLDVRRARVPPVTASSWVHAVVLIAIAGGCGFRPIAQGTTALRPVMDAFATAPPVVAWLFFSPN
jgi:hypothetical protein